MSTSHHRDGGRPLDGLRVVVTRSRERSRSLGDALTGAGAEVVYLPTITVGEPASFSELDLALKKLSEGLYTWAVFTSVNAVSKVFERLGHAGLDARALGRTRVAAVGPVTAAALLEKGIRADLQPQESTAGALAEAMGRGPGQVLLPRAEGAPQHLIDSLRAAGWIPDAVAAYRTLPMRSGGAATDAVRAGAFDVLTFASGSAARSFAEQVALPSQLGLASGEPSEKLVVCIGPQTAVVAEAVGFRVDLVAGDHTAAGLAGALTQRLEGRGTMET
ncbi:MAG: uroporphyrinogen-III synthase [Actinomycetota bacterium]|nr:uroporphyrinogen-III synthase [Actinomycetota bacterium]